jgi:hypothetical protein
MTREEKAYRKINRILSRLEPDAAAGVARRLMDSFGRPLTAQRQEAAQSERAQTERPAGNDNRPSFLRTQHRMEFGKQLVEYLNKGQSQGSE